MKIVNFQKRTINEDEPFYMAFQFSSGKILLRKKKAIKNQHFNETHVSNFKYDYLYFDEYI